MTSTPSSPQTPRYVSPVRPDDIESYRADTARAAAIDDKRVQPTLDGTAPQTQTTFGGNTPATTLSYDTQATAEQTQTSIEAQKTQQRPQSPFNSPSSKSKEVASNLDIQATRRSPSPPPRSPPRQLKRPRTKATAATSAVARSPSPPPRSPPRQQKLPGGARAKRLRTPSPPPRSPPRPLKRPGASAAPARLRSASPPAVPIPRMEKSPDGVNSGSTGSSRPLPAGKPANDHQVVTQHYNAVPQYGVKWRSEQSDIRGLRSFNNWVKSCLINKFSQSRDNQRDGLNVLDIGCGKGGDLQKWKSVRPFVRTYVGLDPAEVSIDNARERFEEMVSKNRGRRPFHATFGVKDCFGEPIANLEAVRRVGFDNGDDPRFGQGGFDVVSLMFCLHYAFESETKARQMLANVAGSLKKGGRFIGVIPNSDTIKNHLAKGERQWGNSIYNVEFRDKLPQDGVFRPPFGWKYFYKLTEAVADVPEYVVPFEAFRALAEDFNLELQYQRPFREVWAEERQNRFMATMADRMRVTDRSGRLNLTREEEEAAFFYQAFCFYKV